MYYIAIFAIFFLALKMCSSDDSSSQVRVPTDTDYIYFAQAGLKKRLKDPDSAQFKSTYLSRKSGTPVACGEVNSKNSFGGYSGFKLFLGMGDIVVLEEDLSHGEFKKLWDKSC
jgi:hypothetical protein